MTRLISRYSRGPNTGHNIRINDRSIDVNLARIVYQCEICHGALKRKNKGLTCKSDPTHRGFLHRDEVERAKAKQEENTQQLTEIYDIVDGQVVIK